MRRRWVIVVVGAIVLGASLLGAVTGFYVDLLWFREVGFSTVFWSVYWSKLVLGLVFGSLFFLLLAANLFIAQRITPRFRPFSPEQELIERYRAAIEPHARWVILAFSALIALFVGVAAGSQWETFLLWRSAGDTSFAASSPGLSLADPVFDRDPAFYIFILPFHKFLQGWLFSALVGVTVITGIAHYLSGGIRTQAVGEKVTPQVKAHLSVLLGLVVLVKAWGYYLGRFDLLVSPRGVVTGASYTDVHAQLPALTLLVVIAVVCAVLFFVNIRLRGWAFPVIGIGLLALSSVVAGAIYPAIVQQLSVRPQERQREEPFIERNIAATRFAFGLDRIELTRTDVGLDVTPDMIDANEPTIDNIRLWSPSVLQTGYQQLQRIQPYYEFVDVDVDRYVIDGEERLVMLSPREVSQNGIPGGGGTWQNKHLEYTHGYAAAASRVSQATPEGAPLFVLRDIPPDAEASDIDFALPHGPQVYFGELSEVPYVVVGGVGQEELDYPLGQGQQQGSNTTTYEGTGGISLGSFFRRLLFAYRYRDINLLISGLIDDQSRILINRDIRTRVTKAAPFLTYDGDPYAAIVDGRLVFIWDGYTITDRYPYSQELNLAEATNGNLSGQANYMRNSVKAVVDAYDGTITFYVVDPTDPLIQVWARAFPDLFEPAPERDSALFQHFRYPENLLQVQAMQFANYHVVNPTTFYQRSLFWAVPPALPTSPDPAEGTETGESGRPYYVLTKLPGEQDEEFVLFQPLTPFRRINMVAYMAARSDPEHYGELVAFEFPTGLNIDGPQGVRSKIDQDPVVSQQVALLGQVGSRVIYGDLLVVPIEDSFLYVQPIFVRSSTATAIPELKRVAIVHAGGVTLGNSLGNALELSFGTGGGVTPPPPPTGEEDEVAQLLAEADMHFQAAEEALREGDLATYQMEIDAGIELVRRAEELASGEPTPSPSPTPTPTPTASPTG